MKREEMEAHLADLNGEHGELDAAIEAMIAAMAEADSESRKSGVWARDGESTLKYLELIDRQAAVESAIVELNRAIRAGEAGNA